MGDGLGDVTAERARGPQLALAPAAAAAFPLAEAVALAIGLAVLSAVLAAVFLARRHRRHLRALRESAEAARRGERDRLPRLPAGAPPEAVAAHATLRVLADDLREREDALQERARAFHSALEAATGAIAALHDESGIARLAAEEAVRLSGARRADVAFGGARGATASAGGEPAADSVKVVLPLEFGGERVGVLTLVHARGEAAPSPSSPPLRILAREVAMSVAHVRAIAALERERERYRALHEHAPFGVLVAVDGVIVLANRAAVRLLRQFSLPCSLDDFTAWHVNPVDAPHLEEAFLRLDREPDRPARVVVDLRAAGGDARPVEVTCSTSREREHRVVQLFLRDRRDELKAEHDLSERTAQLVRNEKFAALGTLAAGVAHEINNPLAFIRGNEDLLAASLEDALKRADLPEALRAELDDGLQSLRTNREGLRRIQTIVASLRQFAKPSRARQDVDVNDIARGALLLSRPKFDGGKRVESDLAPGALRVRGNADELGQVLLNLLVNAAEATPAGGVVRARTRSLPGGGVEVVVEDDGPGVPPSAVARLFHPFFTTKEKGTGLGLSISHGIVTSHGGRISYETRPGGGARFVVTLPPP